MKRQRQANAILYTFAAAMQPAPRIMRTSIITFAFLLVFLLLGDRSTGQDTAYVRDINDTATTPAKEPTRLPEHIRKKRLLTVGSIEAAFIAGSFITLNEAWYSNYQRQPFHFFNDWDEWMQMDKLGHAMSTYSGSRVGAGLWRWTGMDRKKAAWTATLSSMAYLTMVEMLDGYSEKWGFSMGDMYMNTLGAGLFLSQELGWKEQRLTLKISYFPVKHDPSYRSRTDELFGTGGVERFLKDYNGQTLWLSGNLSSFFRKKNIPKWLNISLGHNARTMLGGTENVWTDNNGNTIDRTDVQRYRRFFLSLDVDLTRIPVKSKALRTVFSVINVFKIPAPTLELDANGKFRAYLLYF